MAFERFKYSLAYKIMLRENSFQFQETEQKIQDSFAQCQHQFFFKNERQIKEPIVELFMKDSNFWNVHRDYIANIFASYNIYRA